MKLSEFLSVLVFMLALNCIAYTQSGNEIYILGTTRPGLEYGFSGIQYEKTIVKRKHFKVSAYAGLKFIWGGHYYRGFAYPCIPVGGNLLLGKEQHFFEAGGGLGYFWGQGSRPEIHVAYQAIFHRKYFLKLMVSMNWIQTTEVFSYEREDEIFRNMQQEFLVGMVLGRRF